MSPFEKDDIQTVFSLLADIVMAADIPGISPKEFKKFAKEQAAKAGKKLSKYLK